MWPRSCKLCDRSFQVQFLHARPQSFLDGKVKGESAAVKTEALDTKDDKTEILDTKSFIVYMSRRVENLQSFYGVPESSRSLDDDNIDPVFFTLWANSLYFAHNLIEWNGNEIKGGKAFYTEACTYSFQPTIFAPKTIKRCNGQD